MLTQESNLKHQLKLQPHLSIDTAKHQQSMLILWHQLEVLPVLAFKPAIRVVCLLRYSCSVWHAGVEVDPKEQKLGKELNL
jgi:hypothetical protein